MGREEGSERWWAKWGQTKNPPFVTWGMEMQEAAWVSLPTSLGLTYHLGGVGTRKERNAVPTR